MKYGYAALCLLLVSFIGACKKDRESFKVASNDITESVYASGRIKAIGQYTVYATVNGLLQNIPVDIGDYVVKGQPLFELDNLASGLNAENARIALELSTEYNRKGSDKLQEAELNVKQALEKLRLDSTLFIRQKKLWEQNVGTQLEYDQRKLAYDNSVITYKTTRSRLAQIELQLQNEMQRAGVNYELNKKMFRDYTILSAVDGKVYDILKERGELITTQMPLAIIGKADTFMIELEVDENDILKIRPGQLVLVTMDSYKGQVLEAVVDKIYPIMNERTRTFSVESHFLKPPATLYPNLSLEANIVIQTKKDVVTIPNNYIIDGKFVMVDRDEKREIKTGLKDYQKSEIISGLKPDEIIYKP